MKIVVSSVNKKEPEMFNVIKNLFGSDSEFAQAVNNVFRLQAEAKRRGAERRIKTAGYVYFVSDGKYIKIGETQNSPEKRVSALKVASPNCKLIGCIKTDDRKSLESQLHDKYKKRHIAGEWYNIKESTVKSIIRLIERKRVCKFC